MLGFGAISSRAISGGAFALIAVPMLTSASGAFVTISGSATPGVFIPFRASGSLLTIGGSANSHWTQRIAASGAIITFSGDALLRLAGRPLKITALADSFRITAQADRYKITALAQPYSMKGYR